MDHPALWGSIKYHNRKPMGPNSKDRAGPEGAGVSLFATCSSIQWAQLAWFLLVSLLVQLARFLLGWMRVGYWDKLHGQHRLALQLPTALLA